MKDTTEKLQMSKLTTEEQCDYVQYESDFVANHIGIVRSYELGFLHGTETIIKRCLKHGVAVNDIAILTGFDEKHITELGSPHVSFSNFTPR